MNRDTIDLYEDGGRKLTKAIQGLSQQDLAARPVPGKWSIQQLVVHMADADLVLSDRMKRVIAEEKAVLLAFDEQRWVQHLQYDHRDASEAAELFALNRRATAALLKVLPPAVFERKGVHSERGEMSLEKVVQTAIDHLDHHLKFLYEKREAMGKLMW